MAGPECVRLRTSIHSRFAGRCPRVPGTGPIGRVSGRRGARRAKPQVTRVIRVCDLYRSLRPVRGDASVGALWEPRLRASCGCRYKLRPDFQARDDLVDGSVLHGLLGGQDEVAVGVLGHALEWLPRMPGDDLVHQLPVANDLLGLDLDVDGLALGVAVGLVQEDPRVRERVAFAL